MPRHLLSLDMLSQEEIDAITSRAQVLSEHWRSGGLPQSLAGKRVALVEDDGGWRNTSALDLGVQALGGICSRVPLSLSGAEAIEDLAAYLGNWFDLIAIRTPHMRHLNQLAEAASIPVMNLRTRMNHPCETLGDLSYIKASRGRLDGLTVVAVAPLGNILKSWLEAAMVLPIRVIQLYDADYLLEPRATRAGSIETSDSMSALAEADVIITDCWPQDGNRELLLRYQITAERLETVKPGCQFIPCPPVTRGQEVSAEAVAHPSYVSPAAKAYLLHGQNAYLEWALAQP